MVDELHDRDMSIASLTRVPERARRLLASLAYALFYYLPALLTRCGHVQATHTDIAPKPSLPLHSLSSQPHGVPHAFYHALVRHVPSVKVSGRVHLSVL